MTVARKLILAIAIVAVGYGAASWLGKPAHYTRAPESGFALPKQPLFAAASRSEARAATTPYRSDVRLVPEFGTKDFHGNAAALVSIAPALLPADDSTASQPLVADDNAATIGRSHSTSIEPKATLRNEAPRPLAIEPRPQSSVERLPPVSPQAEAAVVDRDGAPAQLATSDLTPARYTQTADFVPTISGSYNAPIESTAGVASIAPPPWPMPAKEEGPRKHVVVDGDSLAKLAGRYLDDPHRSDEIYELNRGTLTDRELLPIGAELVIPARTSTPAIDTSSPQSFVPRAVAVNAGSRGLVPVRPIPSPAGVMPRALLSRPLPVE